MDSELLERLQHASDDRTLRALIVANDLTVDTVEALKEHSAAYYFADPAAAVRIGEIACRLGVLLPIPAAALGRWTLANALLFANRYREAADLFDRARAEYLSLGLTLDAARMGVGHVGALAYTGRFTEALQLAREIEPVLATAARTIPADRPRLASVFNNVGITCELMGHYEEALEAYDRKLLIARDRKNRMDVARTQVNRTSALTRLNAFDEALAASYEAEDIFATGGAVADLARLYINRGLLFMSWGRHGEAETALLEADACLSTLEGMAQQRHALTVFRVLARLYSGAPTNPALCDVLAEAQAALAVHGPPFQEAMAWIGLGRCYTALGEWSTARNAFRQAQNLAAQAAGRHVAYLTLHGLGQLAEAQGHRDEARTAYESAIEQVEAMRGDLYVEAFRAGYLADKLDVYADLALLHSRLDRPQAAFAVVEQARSRLLSERLAFRLSDETAHLAASEHVEVRALARRLQTVLEELEHIHTEVRLAQAMAQEDGWPSTPARTVIDRVEKLEDETVTLVRRIQRVQPLFSSLATGDIVSLERVQANLRESVLLQYHLARGQVWLFVVDGSGIRAHLELAPMSTVEMARRRLSASIERALGLATRYGLTVLRQYLPSLLADAEAHLAALYDLLVRPVEDKIRPGQTLLFSPDGSLHYVPFHALHDGSASLLEGHAVGYTPSATVLDLCMRHGARGEGMLILGHSDERLQQVGVETAILRRLYPEAEVLLEAQATARRFLADAPRYGLLHLATHAHFRTDNPMLSSLSLADRRLTLAEIARLRLQADLAVLSGCETGRGQMHGSDLISLATGFLGAGVRSLVVSLWRVDDASTAQLVERFYRALRDGQSPAVALRTAQLALLDLGRASPDEHGIYRHPAYWAPFVLIGDNDP